MKAGKHVLCEKPIGLSSSDVNKLLIASQSFPQLKVMEAFMYRFHPQWQYVKESVSANKIGELKIVQSFFTYYNIDPNNIRNRVEVGGGAMMDIGCYCVSLSRFLFCEEPIRVLGLIEKDPEMQTDRISSGILDFPKGTATFTCSTQLIPHQRVNILGTKGRIEIEIPFNMPPEQKAKVMVYTPTGSEEIFFDAVDQYTIQADQFVIAINDKNPVPYGLEDAVNNMKVIEAIVESAKDKSWKNIIHENDSIG
jgi:predicted dehydrogenase